MGSMIEGERKCRNGEWGGGIERMNGDGAESEMVGMRGMMEWGRRGK